MGFRTPGYLNPAVPLRVAEQLPWRVEIDPFPTAHAQTSWDTIGVNTSALNTAYKDGPTAIGASIEWDVVLAPGTWTYEQSHVTFTSRGIYTVRLDGEALGTIDAYSATLTQNVRTSLAGLVVSGLARKRRLQLIVLSKNASSTDYAKDLNAVELRRTA